MPGSGPKLLDLRRNVPAQAHRLDGTYIKSQLRGSRLRGHSKHSKHRPCWRCASVAQSTLCTSLSRVTEPNLWPSIGLTLQANNITHIHALTYVGPTAPLETRPRSTCSRPSSKLSTPQTNPKIRLDSRRKRYTLCCRAMGTFFVGMASIMLAEAQRFSKKR